MRKEEEEERENRRKKQERSQSKDHASFSGYSGQNIGKGYDRDFGETTETKLQHLNGALSYKQIIHFFKICLKFLIGKKV